MIKASDLKFLGYLDWKGPFWRGSQPFKLPDNPGTTDRILDVISKTEGPYYDSYNGYDSCRMTISPIQLCERGQYAASDLLGWIQEYAGHASLGPIHEFGAEHGFTFRDDAKSRWRFHFDDTRGSIGRDEELTRLTWLDSHGNRGEGPEAGQWNPNNKNYALGFAASVVNVMANPNTFIAQRAWLGRRISKYAFGYAKQLLGEVVEPQAIGGGSASPIACAFEAALLSFCINNPSWAAKHAEIGDTNWKGERWTLDWLIHMTKQLTFGPQVAIYPHRWDAIRPALERNYGLDLPDSATQLKAWTAEGKSVVKTLSAENAQWILRHILFFDLGKSGPNEDGVDGVWGKKSRDATKRVQELTGLQVDGEIGKDTVVVLIGARDAWLNLSDAQQKDLTARMRLNILAKAVSHV